MTTKKCNSSKGADDADLGCGSNNGGIIGSKLSCPNLRPVVGDDADPFGVLKVLPFINNKDKGVSIELMKTI